jgi:hypothetical protein
MSNFFGGKKMARFTKNKSLNLNNLDIFKDIIKKMGHIGKGPFLSMYTKFGTSSSSIFRGDRFPVKY